MMIKKYKFDMPKCLDRECVNGIRSENKDGYLVQKICAKCQQMEKDLLESEDYEVSVVNGRATGYDIIN